MRARSPGSSAAARRRARARRPRAGVLVLACALGLACGNASGKGLYQGRGVVRDVHREFGQVVIEHEDIPGLMPAMTMNFDLADPERLGELAPGQVIDFELEFTGRSYRIVGWKSVGSKAVPAVGLGLDAAARAAQPAPDFRLTDQNGAPLALADLRGKAVLLDFVYTRCPGPCPILTGVHVEAERKLSPEARAQSRFVSITLDPAYDTPERLGAYARARGADLDHWSFLTGPVAEVEDVVSHYGVGTVRQADGEIEHLVVTFLIDAEGQIAHRYLGPGTEPVQIARDLERVLGGGVAEPAAAAERSP